MARVAGRIIFLTVSMITIIGIRKPGVPDGTRWAIRLLYCKRIDISILPSHSGNERVKVIDRWLVQVKI